MEKVHFLDWTMVCDATEGYIWVNDLDAAMGLVNVLRPGYHLML